MKLGRLALYGLIALMLLALGTFVFADELPWRGVLTKLFDDFDANPVITVRPGDPGVQLTSIRTMGAPRQVAADGSALFTKPANEEVIAMNNHTLEANGEPSGQAVIRHPNGDLLVRKGMWGYHFNEDGSNNMDEPMPGEDLWLDPYKNTAGGWPTYFYYGEQEDYAGHLTGVWFVFTPTMAGDETTGSWDGQIKCVEHPERGNETAVAVSPFNSYRFRE